MTDSLGRQVESRLAVKRLGHPNFELSAVPAGQKSGTTDAHDFVLAEGSPLGNLPVPDVACSPYTGQSHKKNHPPGLVYKRICDQSPVSAKQSRGLAAMECYKEDVQFRQPLTATSHRGGGRRGKINEFSDAARRRLLFTLRNVDGLRVMLTLTFPACFPTDGNKVKTLWSKMRLWLTRRKTRDGRPLGGVWFLEFQERGAPHIHVLLNGRVNKTACSEKWAQIVGSDDPKHLLAGTRVERIRKPETMAAYAAKRIGKRVPDGYEHVGQFWSTFGGVKATPHQVITGTVADIAPYRRVARKIDAKRNERRGWRAHRDKGRVGKTFYSLAPVMKQYVDKTTAAAAASACAAVAKTFNRPAVTGLIPLRTLLVRSALCTRISHIADNSVVCNAIEMKPASGDYETPKAPVIPARNVAAVCTPIVLPQMRGCQLRIRSGWPAMMWTRSRAPPDFPYRRRLTTQVFGPLVSTVFVRRANFIE